MSLDTSIATLKAKRQAIQVNIPESLRQTMTYQSVVQSVALSFRQNPRLSQCDPETVYFAVSYIVMLGLEIGGFQQQAFLIPYGKTCKPQIGAQGRIELAYRSGKIKLIRTDVVHENDDFSFELGNGDLHHTFDLRKSDRGPIIGAWCRVWTASKPEPLLEIMTAAQFAVIERAVETKNNGKLPSTYRLYRGEMMKRSVVNRALKRAPKSVELMDALYNDGRIEVNEAHVTVTDKGRVDVIDAEMPDIPLSYDDADDVEDDDKKPAPTTQDPPPPSTNDAGGPP